MKKIICLCIFCFFNIVFLFASPSRELPDDKFSEGLFQYGIRDNKAYVWNYTGTEKVVQIPEFLGGVEVVGIDNLVVGWVDVRNNTMETLIIPNSVTQIYSSAFHRCVTLTHLQLDEGHPKYVFKDGALIDKTKMSLYHYLDSDPSLYYIVPDFITEIESFAFTSKHLTYIEMGESVKKIHPAAFATSSGLKAIELSESITKIERDTFSGCKNLTAITIPNSVTTIGAEAFAECTSLQSITLPKNLEVIDRYAFAACTSLTELTIPDTVHTIGDGAFELSLDGASIALPKALTTIQYSAFAYSNIKEVIIPSSVIAIEKEAFKYCKNLESIILPPSVQSIGFEAFYECEKLVRIEIPHTLSVVEAGAFSRSGLVDIIVSKDHPVYSFEDGVLFDNTTQTLHTYLATKQGSTYAVPQHIEHIGDYAFYKNRSLEELSTHNSLKSIGIKAFNHSTVKKLVLSADNAIIKKDAFSRSQLEYLEIKGTNTHIGWGAFSNSKLNTVLVSGTIKTIEELAFQGCPFTTLLLPEGIEKIEPFAFAGCNIQSFHIPNSLSDIDGGFLAMATDLQNITIQENHPTYKIEDGILYSKDSTVLHTYLSTKKDTSFSIAPTVTIIEEYAFSYAKNLQTVHIPPTVTAIKEGAFSDSALTSVTIPQSVTHIAKYNFDEYDNIVLYIEAENSYAHQFAVENNIDYIIGYPQ